jgi:uncharacterized protein YgiM (DUF1202 family)
MVALMKRIAILAIFALFACKSDRTLTDTLVADTREPIRIEYVGAPELPVRERPDDSAPVIITYQSGESVSILAEQGEWVEIRTGDQAGWVRKADLATAEEQAAAEEDPQVRFRIMPLPVSAPGATGEVYIEADVNTEGEVVATRIITNTTGSAALAAQNEAALRSARFHPIIQKNERKPFKYYHRVSY